MVLGIVFEWLKGRGSPADRVAEKDQAIEIENKKLRELWSREQKKRIERAGLREAEKTFEVKKGEEL